MRKLLSKKAGATFLQETSNFTFNVRRDGIEIINKVKPGVYMILTLCRTGKDKAVLFADWGTYFNRLTNPDSQLPKLEKCCPTLFSILVGEDKDGISELEIGGSETDHSHGFGLEITIPKNTSLLFCLGPDIIPHAIHMADKMLKVYNELVSNPPFPAWRYGLDDVWE